MRTVTATAAKQHFAQVLDDAETEPVVIRRRDRDVAVVLSLDAWQQLTRHNVAGLQALCDRVSAAAAAQGMNEEVLADLLATPR
ncbi:MAG: type II toxin-antitoxin system Phd/YefM family antitoxin [Deltaproteobacteria bacterium]|nr:type II toxin-antitoxin system Phd/YefM family antitoxin [Deltaproteobacteria bacterium]